MTNNTTRLCAVLALATMVTVARSEDYNGTPVGHLVHRHNTGEIRTMIAQGWRPTSIGYESSVGNTGYFRVAYVQNTGTHALECRFEGDATQATIQYVRSAGWRIEDIEYQGSSRFAGIFIRNNVAPKTTTWFTGNTASSIQTWLTANPTYRLLELDRYGTDSYSGVYIRNVGAGFVNGSGWYPDSTLSTINQWATANGMRVVDIDRGSNGRYAAVFEKAQPGQRFYYFGAMSYTRMFELLQGMGLRAVSIAPRVQDGVTTYTMTTVNNANAQSARLADMTWPLHNGFHGFYVQRIGAGASVDLNGSRPFHPSSSIKTLFHYTGASTTLTSQLNTRMISGELMVSRHQDMMWNSDNADANLLMDTYTIPDIEDIAHDILGMSNVTQLRNRMGTGGPYGNDEINETTLLDMGILYQAIQEGRLGATKTSWMRSNMLNETNSAPWNNVIQAERVSVGLSTAEYNDWISRIRYVLKAGNNRDSNNINGYWSACGVMTLPWKSSGIVTNRNYLFGHFVNRSTINYGGWTPTGEMLREQIRASMATFN